MKKTTTKQAGSIMNLNPTGRGGFGDHPENRSDGRWDKKNSQSYWLNFFNSLTVEELEAYPYNNPPSKMTVACAKAYEWTLRAQINLNVYKETTNRTEGVPNPDNGENLVPEGEENEEVDLSKPLQDIARAILAIAGDNKVDKKCKKKSKRDDKGTVHKRDK